MHFIAPQLYLDTQNISEISKRFEMKRKPNARGGRNNKTKHTATRARFSNWKPPSKNIRDRLTSVRGQRDSRISKDARHTDEKNSPRGTPAVTPNPENIGALEEIVIPDIILRELCALFQLELTDRGNVSLHKRNPTNQTQFAPETSNRAPMVAGGMEKLPFQLSKSTTRVAPTSEAELQMQRLHTHYTTMGFLSEEIFSCAESLKQYKDENEVFLRLLLTAAQHDMSSWQADVARPPGLAESMLYNEELMMELEVLESMYSYSDPTMSADDSSAFPPSLRCEHMVLFGGLPCTRIEVHLPHHTATPAGPGPDTYSVRLVLFITRADVYPAEGSMVYGWLVSPGDGDGADSAPSQEMRDQHAALSRDVSLRVMTSIQEQLATHRSIVCFDFIQGICEGLVSWTHTAAAATMMEAPKKHSDRDRPPHDKAKSGLEKGGKKKSSGAPSGQSTDPVSGECVDRVVPRPLVQPLTNHRQSPEYREALNAALNSGLQGAQARAQVRYCLSIRVD